MIHIRQVTTRREVKGFVRMAWKVNAADPNWVPPLISERATFLDPRVNPFFRDNRCGLFLACRNGDVVGRIAAVVPGAGGGLGDRTTGSFGFLEAVQNDAVFAALLGTARDVLRRAGCVRMVGPLNPSIHYDVGFLVDGFDSPPFFMLGHNPPYYGEVMQQLGYTKVMDFHAYIAHTAGYQLPARVLDIGARVRARGRVSIRSGRMRDFDEELETVRGIYNDAWSGHWGFSPAGVDEFAFLARGLKDAIDPDLVLIAECGGEPAGFLLCLPNYNEILIHIRSGRLIPFGIFRLLWGRNKLQSARIITVGIRRKFQHLGLGSLLYPEITERLVARGFAAVEFSWVAEDNQRMNRIARLLGGQIHKTYRVYQTELG